MSQFDRDRQSLAAHEAQVDASYEPFPIAALAGTIGERFAEIVRRFPDNAAVADTERSFTYRQLADETRRIALALEAAAGDRPGPVAIFLPNEARFVAAMLAALTIGRGYVGLDVSHPPERNRLIAEHAGIAAIVTSAAHRDVARDLLPAARLVDIEELPSGHGEPKHGAAPDDMAWLIYTSGSTGQPKGVYQNHRGLLHDIAESVASLHLGATDRQALFVSPSLISGARAAFGALLTGGALHCLPLSDRSPAELAEAIRGLGITLFRSVPAIFRNAVRGLPPGGRFDSLRMVLLGGDRVEPDDYALFCRACRPDAVFGVHLGATECSTLYLQWFMGHGGPVSEQTLPVGRPIAGWDVALLDDYGDPVTDGEPGEFVVSGQHLALGYWRDAAATAAAFSTAPGGAGRTFRTGDLGIRRADGLYEHRGRKDGQLKLRGNRIETGDIEQALRRCTGVKDGAVAARRNDRGAPNVLIGYVELQPGTRGLLPRHVQAMLARQLPAHMVPAQVVILDALPRLPNFKVDRVALAALDDTRARQPNDGGDLLVNDLIHVFESVLGTSGATADDTVFTLGGDSLQAVSIAQALEEKFALAAQPADRPLTIREIAAQIARLRQPQATAAGRAE
jgi:amino acid adenylation domain-containing protein